MQFKSLKSLKCSSKCQNDVPQGSTPLTSVKCTLTFIMSKRSNSLRSFLYAMQKSMFFIMLNAIHPSMYIFIFVSV